MIDLELLALTLFPFAVGAGVVGMAWGWWYEHHDCAKPDPEWEARPEYVTAPPSGNYDPIDEVVRIPGWFDVGPAIEMQDVQALEPPKEDDDD